MLDQSCLDSLVGRTANPLPFFVEVGVLRVLPRGAVVSFVVALAATIAVIPTVALSAVTRGVGLPMLVECPLIASPVRHFVVLLPLVDQSLADEQETLEGFLSLEYFILPGFFSLLKLLVKHRIGVRVSPGVACSNEYIQQVF